VEGRPQEARLTASQVRGVRFSSTRFRPGYVEEEVDAFLDEIADELERYGLH
jgi:DivIVA domain-containing protein